MESPSRPNAATAAGSRSAAVPRVAAILSVVESCRRLQVTVRDYLSTILPDPVPSGPPVRSYIPPAFSKTSLVSIWP
jgi:hypothetical protein